MGQGSSSAGTPQRATPPPGRADGTQSPGTPVSGRDEAHPVAAVATAAAASSDVHDEDEDDVSFNYNSESSEDDKFPTAVVLVLPEVRAEDPAITVDSSLRRVAKDFIGSN